ncbi:MAG: hypothetical protein ABW022_03225 [Actinoplanes sp.]
MSNVLDDPRVTPNGRDYLVRILHGEYLVEEDDRTTPASWRVFDESGLRVCAARSTDPLRSVGSVAVAHASAKDAVGALLACDEEQR